MNTKKDCCCEKCGTAEYFSEIADSFWLKTRPNGKCLEWIGTISANGYGVLSFKGRQWKAHRVSKALSGVLVPHDLVIDHLCRNTKCVNPEHLRVCTNAENVMVGESFAPKNKAKESCLRGHPYATYGRETVRKDGTKWRACRKCGNENDRVTLARRRLNRKST